MTERNYWLDLFTGATWQRFVEAGAKVSGFSERRWATVRRMRPGDYLLCYLTGISRFVGVVEVTGPAFKGTDAIWKEATFPARVPVSLVHCLTPETAVPVLDLREQLSVFQNLKNPNWWSGAFRGSPALWERADGEIVLRAIQEAQENPVTRSVDPKKLARRPQGLATKNGPVAVPSLEGEPDEPVPGYVAADSEEVQTHTEVQATLLKLGADMGLRVWVARNDRNRVWKGKALSDLPGCLAELPVQFDEATSRTIELIDVLWLQKSAIVAAFEVESTTLIYSGLLRMADLVAMQPNINIPLYLVAPDDRRERVFEQVNRPTFSRQATPLVDVCRYIPFSALRAQLGAAPSLIKYLKPEFLQELSESCELED